MRRHDAPPRFSAALRRQMGKLLEPSPLSSELKRSAGAEAADAGRLRAALARFEKKHGADATIGLLKAELERRGEERWRTSHLAPHPGDTRGQTSILDAGR